MEKTERKQIYMALTGDGRSAAEIEEEAQWAAGILAGNVGERLELVNPHVVIWKEDESLEQLAEQLLLMGSADVVYFGQGCKCFRNLRIARYAMAEYGKLMYCSWDLGGNP